MSTSLAKGLDFPSNGEANSAIRLEFKGANRPSRTLKTVLWEAKYTYQIGYYAWPWDAWGDNNWHDGWYESGAHPFPCDGTVNPNGSAALPTSGSGEAHYFEVAGAGTAADWIATPGGTSYSVPMGVWIPQGFTDEVVNIDGTDYVRRTFYVDLNTPSKTIIRDQEKSALDAIVPIDPMFAFGNSSWRDNAGGIGITDEASSGIYRKMYINSNKMSVSDMVAVLACESDAEVSALGIADAWYQNINPTPLDISDKSGSGHTPSWSNDNRPILWDASAECEIYVVEAGPNWQITGRSPQRNVNRPGKTLILECTETELVRSLAGRSNLNGLSAWYQNHLNSKGFVGITLSSFTGALN